jgi:hypothetical protein
MREDRCGRCKFTSAGTRPVYHTPFLHGGLHCSSCTKPTLRPLCFPLDLYAVFMFGAGPQLIVRVACAANSEEPRRSDSLQQRSDPQIKICRHISEIRNAKYGSSRCRRTRKSTLASIVVNILFNLGTIHIRTTWPVGAMVARSPPKAEAVGSSPTSVACVPLSDGKDHASLFARSSSRCGKMKSFFASWVTESGRHGSSFALTHVVISTVGTSHSKVPTNIIFQFETGATLTCFTHSFFYYIPLYFFRHGVDRM